MRESIVSADATPLCPIPHLLCDSAPSVREVSISHAADDPGMLARGPNLPWGTRKALPARRRNRTVEARIGAEGGHKLHLTVDLDNDGRPCAIKVSVHKEGAVFRGMLDAFADQASAQLQRGAPIQEVASEMRFVRFEPDGLVHGHDTIKSCTSLVDLLGQLLLAEFPATENT